MQNNESGRSMIEMLGVLGIMGILIFGAVTGINSGMTSYRINRVYSDIHETIQGIQDMYLAVYGRNQYPIFECDANTETESEDCKRLKENDIQIREMVIKTDDCEGGLCSKLMIDYNTPNEDFCTRLKNMDWALLSINVSDTICKEGNLPTTLTFSPK